MFICCDHDGVPLTCDVYKMCKKCVKLCQKCKREKYGTEALMLKCNRLDDAVSVAFVLLPDVF